MTSMKIEDYISAFGQIKYLCEDLQPWIICAQANNIVQRLAAELGTEYVFDSAVAVHRNAVVEQGVIFKGPIIIGKDCFIAAHSYLREGVFLGEGVTIGPGCEVKASFIFPHSTLAHFNYVGNSLIGSHVNLEAGVVVANHYNECDQKEIEVLLEGRIRQTGVTKFGALIGDYTKIGANAVTTPGTILIKDSIIKRLALVEQLNASRIAPKPGSAMQLRPHHILDILRNYGHDKAFEPHPYGHALHTVAHALLANIDTKIELVLGSDEICRPCRYLRADGQCDDILPQLPHPLSKQIYNDTLDQRLFAYLRVSPGSVMSLRDFLKAVNNKAPGLELLCIHPGESAQFRLDGLLQGLQRLEIR